MSVILNHFSKKEIVWALAALAACLILAYLTVKLPWFLITGVLVAAGVAVFSWRSPFAVFLVLVFFLPFERIGSYDFSGITIRPSQILALVLLVVWAVKAVVQKNFKLAKNPLLIPLFAFLLANLISIGQAANLERSILVFLFTLFTILFSLLIPNLITDEAKLKRVVGILLLTTTLVCLFGLWQFFGDMLNLPTTITGLREHYTKMVFGFPRIQSTALEPLYFANFLFLPMALVYSFLVSRSSSMKIIRLLPFFILITLNLVLTVSRGGYLGAIVLGLVISLIYFRRVFRLKFILPLLVGVFLVSIFAIRALGFGDVFQINFETFAQHVRNVFSGPAYLERIETFEGAKQAWYTSPIIGIGPGQYGPFVASHPYLEPKEGWKIVNNEFIELLAETGVLGLGLFLIVLFILFFRSLKAIARAPNPYLKAIMVALFAAFLGVLAQYQTFSILYIMHVWFLIGLMISVQNLILKPSEL